MNFQRNTRPLTSHIQTPGRKHETPQIHTSRHPVRFSCSSARSGVKGRRPSAFRTSTQANPSLTFWDRHAAKTDLSACARDRTFRFSPYETGMSRRQLSVSGEQAYYNMNIVRHVHPRAATDYAVLVMACSSASASCSGNSR